GAGALDAAEADAEQHLHVLDVVGVDLFQRREAVTLVVAVVQEPVLRLFGGIERTLVGHVGRARRGERRGQQERSDNGSGTRHHGHLSSSLSFSSSPWRSSHIISAVIPAERSESRDPSFPAFWRRNGSRRSRCALGRDDKRILQVSFAASTTG